MIVVSRQGLVRLNILDLVFIEAVLGGCPSQVRSAVKRHMCVYICTVVPTERCCQELSRVRYISHQLDSLLRVR